MTLTYASAFAGVGGFDLAFDRAGMHPTVQIEIDRQCLRVLTEHWPTVPKGGDIREFSGKDLGNPDVLCGGFPCKDTSIAAPHRLGLAGSRSGLYWEFHRLLDEHLRLVDESRPRWTIIENPDGLLRSNGGRDMAAVVRGLENLGYGWAYRVVDGRHLGTPQRRRRVFVVGHRGGDPRPAWQVLGDDDTGSEVARPGAVRGAARRSRPAASPSLPGGVIVWRKSARARAKLAAGGYETWVADGQANTLTGFDGGAPDRQTHLILQSGRLRTLTAREWERLQGFPDDWTATASPSARWEQLGNAIAVPMAAWLARRLMAVDAALPMIPLRRTA